MVVPLLNSNAPLPPFDDTDPDAIVIDPEPPQRAVPLLSTMPPDEPTLVDAPEAKLNPPVPTDDVPLLTNRPPLVPPDDAPDATVTLPLTPLLVVPLLNTIVPLAAAPTAFALRTVTDPLPDAVPYSATIVTAPPLVEPLPELMNTEPPGPLVP